MIDTAAQLVKIIKEICNEEGIDFTSFSDEYILLLQKNGKSMYIYGNKFPNNNSAAEIICDDKAGLSEVLSGFGIPNVKHIFFASPKADWYYSDETADRNRMLELLKEYPEGIVIKDNRGTGGLNVYKALTEEQLSEAVDKVFTVSPSLSVSPFVSINHEFRVLMFEGRAMYAFEKLRRFVEGDGKNTVSELVREKYGEAVLPTVGQGETVPENGEKIYIEWRHNLGQGASPKLVEDRELLEKLSVLAGKCMSALNLNFASVDVVDVAGELQVLEINSGVMIDNFSQYSTEYYTLAKGGIKAAIKSYLQIKSH